MSDFDAQVAEIRARGIAPRHKPFGKNKVDCTPEQWAAHREYFKARYQNPALRLAHERYQRRYLAKRR